ncbi:MAG: asparaginase [Bacteroidia bacterium]|nr:asparaginase [Bacteroidia bacterium]NNJ56149.1 asparaginase [Bacteroidia bacterium]
MKSKVFILYTGGTFGMKESENGLEPSTWKEIIEYLPAIKNQTYFNHFSSINFTFDTLEPVVDSSNMNPAIWKRIADCISDNYNSHDGFIVIHGTDTLSYTASALSFMFENLSKPIVLTGAQLPIFHPRTDGIINLSNAIYIAGYKRFELTCIPEVCICFNDDLLRGNRAIKSSTNDFEGFSSPNFENLASLEQRIQISENVLPIPEGKELKIYPTFSQKVVNVTVFPGYNVAALQDLVDNKKIEGIVLKTFGSGNLPKDDSWKQLVQTCEKNEVIILATTQSANGRIEIGQYAASNFLKNPIVANGKDITSPAALTKLMWVIGNFEFKDRIKMLSKSLRGEISLYN